MPIANYVTCFYENIRSVIIESDIQKLSTDFLCLGRSEYKQIQFKHVFFEGRHPLPEKAVNILGKITTIGFWKGGFDRTIDFRGHLLKFCHCLKKLIFYQFRGDLDCQWMLHKYPVLEDIQCCLTIAHEGFDKKISENFRQFLQLNPAIKKLTWHFEDWTFEIINILKIIHKYGTDINELYLSFDIDGYTDAKYNTTGYSERFREKLDTEEICDILKPLCERRNFKRMEIKIKGSRVFSRIKQCLISISINCQHYRKCMACTVRNTYQQILNYMGN